jgi:WD40 repeat protein
LLATLGGHSGQVNSARFSPDGQKVLTASSDKTARIWDGRNGSETLVLRTNNADVLSAEFSPDGLQILTISDDRRARLWDSRDGRSLAELDAGSYGSASFSNDGNRIVIVSSPSVAEVIDARTFAKITKLTGRKVRSAKFSPDGQLIATADEEVIVWDANTGKPLAVLPGSEVEWVDVDFSGDSTKVVTATPSGANVWSARGGEQIFHLTSGRIHSAAFSPDGTKIVTAGSIDSSTKMSVQLWNANTGTVIGELGKFRTFVRRPVFSSDGRRIATTYQSGEVLIWDADQRDGILLVGHSAAVQFAVASADGKRIATASTDHTARIWDSRTGATLAVLEGHTDQVWHVAFSPDGTRVATASKDKTARIWDARSGARIGVLDGHEDAVNFIAFSPDGERVLTASWDSTARIWDSRTGAALAVLKGHTDGLNSAVYSPDGKRIVTTSADESARVWDAAGAPLAVLEGHSNVVIRAEFSPDGQQIVTAAADLSARLWDAHYKLLFVLRDGVTGTGRSVSASFSADGRRVVVGGLRERLRVWDTSTGDVVATFTSPNEHDHLDNPKFHPDGDLILATGMLDGIVRIWDAHGGIQLDALEAREGKYYGASFSSDGGLIIAPSGQTVKIFALASKEDTAAFESIAAFRLLTTTEKNQHFLFEANEPRKGTGPGSADVDECDRLAANPNDPKKRAPGVNFDAIDDRAVDACEAALQSKPDEPRYVYQLGRARARKGDDKRAVELYRRASELGYPVAHNNLALLYETGGAGLPRDPQLAIEHFRAAWDLGMSVVSVNLGRIYIEGKLVPVDRERGLEWLQEGVSAGVAGAHFELANRYSQGNETDLDLEKALYHYAMATRLFEQAGNDGGAQATRRRRGSLARNMDTTSVVRVAAKVSGATLAKGEKRAQ